jgi:folate-binding protein YgfZ
VYKTINVRGVDAADFLQGQLTQDIAVLARGMCLPAAWCNAQGRVVMTLKILADDDGFALVVPASIAEAALARLGMYRLRSRVEFGLADADWQIFAMPGAHGGAAGIWSLDITGDRPFVEIIATNDALQKAHFDTDSRLDVPSWQCARIAAGQVDIAAGNSALYTPHMLNLDLTDAVNFNKGCYTGQEIVARTEHLGRSKRRTFRYHCEAREIVIGETLCDGSNDVGVVVNVSGNELLAVLPIAAAAPQLQIRGVAARKKTLPYDPA